MMENGKRSGSRAVQSATVALRILLFSGVFASAAAPAQPFRIAMNLALWGPMSGDAKDVGAEAK